MPNCMVIGDSHPPNACAVHANGVLLTLTELPQSVEREDSAEGQSPRFKGILNG
jgi:hypothetical protein